MSAAESPGKRLTAITHGSPNSVDDAQVRAQVRDAALERRDAAVGVAAVVLQRLHGGDEHDGARARFRLVRQTMSTNFSKPMSAPKPLSVTT